MKNSILSQRNSNVCGVRKLPDIVTLKAQGKTVLLVGGDTSTFADSTFIRIKSTMKFLMRSFLFAIASIACLGSPIAASAEWKSIGTISSFKGAIEINSCNYRVFVPAPWSTATLPNGTYHDLVQTGVMAYNEKNDQGQTYRVDQYSLKSGWNSLSRTDATYDTDSSSKYFNLLDQTDGNKAILAKEKSISTFTRLDISFLRVKKPILSMPTNHADLNNASFSFDDSKDRNYQGRAYYLKPENLGLEANCGASPSSTPSK